MPTANATRPAADPDAIRRLMHLGLTDKQSQAYLYIFATVMECGYQPSFRETMAYLGLSSPNSVALIIEGLERAGFVRRVAAENRSLRLILCPDGRPFRGFVLPEEQP